MGRTTVIADGGHRGTDLVIAHRRERLDPRALPRRERIDLRAPYREGLRVVTQSGNEGVTYSRVIELEVYAS